MVVLRALVTAHLLATVRSFTAGLQMPIRRAQSSVKRVILVCDLRCSTQRWMERMTTLILFFVSDCKDNAGYVGPLGACFEHAKDLCQGEYCFHHYCAEDGASALDACPLTCGSCPGPLEVVRFVTLTFLVSEMQS